MSDSEDDKPLAARKPATTKMEEDSDDDKPLGASKAKKEPTKSSSRVSGAKRKSMKEESDGDDADDSEDDAPLAKKRAPAKKAKKAPEKKKTLAASSSRSKKAKKEDDAEKPAKKPKKEAKPEYVYEWWKEEEPLPDGKKWRFLEHNGVIFPPKYEPHGVKMKYDGQEVDLNDEQESVATMYAAMLTTDYATKKTFTDNFWKQFKGMLGDKHPIKDLKKCDFAPIQAHLEQEKEKKKTLTKEEKTKIKEAKDKMEEPFSMVILDSHTEKNGNYRVEPAGLFRGRGEHPKMGQIKGVIQPEDISMNCSEDACPPRCALPGHNWQSVVHKDETTWLAYYKDTINGEFKYIFLSAGSSLKGQSDREKFEKARELKKVVHTIRQKITQGLKSSTAATMQQNTALWFIDLLAIRAGNEKDTAEEADTVGCCSLRVEHIELGTDEEGPTILFNFLGKDSIQYKNLLKLRPADEDRAKEGEDDPCVSYVREGEESNFKQVYSNMKTLVKKFDSGRSKKPEDDVFDELTTSTLNSYLKELMPGLTAKVFRTYNASYTLDQELYKLENHPNKKNYMKNEQTQLKFYNDANYQVAILCNHSRAVSKTFDAQMEKMDVKKSDMEKEVVELQKSLKQSGADKDKIKKKIAALQDRISKHETQKEIKQKLAGVALSTSKLNYLDPRITVAWCKKFGDFNLSRVFNKTLQTKFKWAVDEADEDFRF